MILSLEKVLLDPIFMILKCDFFYLLWIVFLETSRRFDLSSRSLGHVMFSFAGTDQLLLPEQFPRKKTSHDQGF